MNPSLKINLGYRDAPAAIRFLVEVLEFEQIVVYPGASQNMIAHAELHWPEGGIVTLHSAEQGKISVAELAAQADAGGGYPAFSVHIDTDNPERLFERVVNSGARIIRELTASKLGRGFIIADPEGLYWSFGTPLPKLTRNEQGQWQPG